MIPKVFHRIWFGPREMPDLYRELGQTWLTMNPKWALVDHGYDNLPQMVNRAAFDAVPERCPNPGGGKANSVIQVQQADIASYELLWSHGGVYLNCDMQALRPLGGLLDGVTCAIAMEDDEYPSNAWMAATPGHPFVKLVLELLPRRMDSHWGSGINEQTGPHLLKQARQRYRGDDVVWFDRSMFMPFDFNHRDEVSRPWPDAYAIHHWGHQIPDEELWSS